MAGIGGWWPPRFPYPLFHATEAGHGGLVWVLLVVLLIILIVYVVRRL